ncbi:hypothetical protein CHARACLAT_012423, partial [Characodon lateralis]|nr:hypothetical protein [Characodon lateralis]
ADFYSLFLEIHTFQVLLLLHSELTFYNVSFHTLKGKSQLLYIIVRILVSVYLSVFSYWSFHFSWVVFFTKTIKVSFLHKHDKYFLTSHQTKLTRQLETSVSVVILPKSSSQKVLDRQVKVLEQTGTCSQHQDGKTSVMS